jgi:hypothetical protein
MDTIKDKDLSSLMSLDWRQRLPDDVRKFKDQIQGDLHIAHHEHHRKNNIHKIQLSHNYQR